MIELPFRDRRQAGRLLGAELASRRLDDVVVLALPRGGLPVAVEVAEALKAPLDVIVVRKLGVPWQPELAMGALAAHTRVLDYAVIRDLGVSDEQLERVIAREEQELRRREQIFRQGLPPIPSRGRTAVLVDDGLATGSTMVAAVRHARSLDPKSIVVAVPVGSSQACRRLGEEADFCICLAQPEPFLAVGEWYLDFPQVSEREVQEILRNANGVLGAL